MDKLATMRTELERLKGENEELNKQLKYLRRWLELCRFDNPNQRAVTTFAARSTPRAG